MSDIVLDTFIYEFLLVVLFFSDIKEVLGFIPDYFSADASYPPTLFLGWPIFDGTYILLVDDWVFEILL